MNRVKSAILGLEGYKRIVIKLGSALLVDPNHGLRTQWLEAFLDDIVALRKANCQVIIVSSGSIALGRNMMGMMNTQLKLEESQAAASIGQIALASTYSTGFAKHNIKTGQILLTLGDTEQRRRYLNARNTIETLLALGAIPVINENDSVATAEIRYGDNDRLAARVATMMTADLLILLSDIDGLYDAPPKENKNAKFIPYVETITPQIEAMAGDAGTELSRGGMVTKIMAAKIATQGGTSMIIAPGDQNNPLRAIQTGQRCTFFKAGTTPLKAKKKWIAGQMRTKGSITIDQGAVAALRTGKSLLPAGVHRINGTFERGDVVEIMDENQLPIGQGIVAYNSKNAQTVMGKHSSDIAKLLGYSGRSELIHSDDLVLHELGKPPEISKQEA